MLGWLSYCLAAFYIVVVLSPTEVPCIWPSVHVLCSLGRGHPLFPRPFLSVAGGMSYKLNQISTALDALELGQFDDVVCEALREQGNPPFTSAQVRDALVAAKLSDAAIPAVIKYLEDAAKLAEGLKAAAVGSTGSEVQQRAQNKSALKQSFGDEQAVSQASPASLASVSTPIPLTLPLVCLRTFLCVCCVFRLLYFSGK